MRLPPTIADRDPPRPIYKRVNEEYTRKLLRHRRYRNWRASIAAQRMRRCDVCWKRDGIIRDFEELHHIKPRSTHPHLVMVASNVLLLCHACHMEIHQPKETEEMERGE